MLISIAGLKSKNLDARLSGFCEEVLPGLFRLPIIPSAGNHANFASEKILYRDGDACRRGRPWLRSLRVASRSCSRELPVRKPDRSLSGRSSHRC